MRRGKGSTPSLDLRRWAISANSRLTPLAHYVLSTTSSTLRHVALTSLNVTYRHFRGR